MIFSDLNFKEMPYMNGNTILEASLFFDNEYGVSILQSTQHESPLYYINIIRDGKIIDGSFIDGYTQVSSSKEEVEDIVTKVENL